MDEEMEENEVVYTFTAVEIDLDYEFDAVRYFDFSREESLAEARQAELWFDTAPSYPPSRKPLTHTHSLSRSLSLSIETHTYRDPPKK